MKSYAFFGTIGLALALSLALAGCGGIGNSTKDNGNTTGGDSAVHLSSNITSATTLDSSKVYVVDDWFYVEATLTIPAGTVIKFKPDTYIEASGTGSIIAVGSSSSHITFTAYTDDTVGGNTDGASGTGSPGYWVGISATTSGNQFQYVDFKYATTGLQIGSVQAVVANDQFLNSSDYGLNAGDAPASTTISSSRFYGNAKPVLISGTVSFDNTNLFTDSAGTTKNTYQAIFLDDDNIVGTVAWSNTQVPFVVQDWAYIEGSFTVSPGVIVKFMPDTYFETSGTGVINAVGVTANRITFTAYTDDIGGDTNANGTTTAGTSGYWAGIELTTAGNQVRYCDFKYATTGLAIGTKQITIDNDQFLYCSVYGLDAGDAPATTAITNDVFYGNNMPILISGTLSFGNTNLFSNTLATIKNTYQGIFLDDDNIAGTVSWSNAQVPYVVQDWAYVEGSFTVGANVIIKFFPETYFDVTGAMVDTSTDVYTAYSDDAFGGDTNADGAATTPSIGYWGGLDNFIPLGTVHWVSAP